MATATHRVVGSQAASANLSFVPREHEPVLAAELIDVLDPRPGAETGYVFVDPDGFVADRAYDLGVVLRDWSSTLLGPDARTVAEGYCRLLAEHTGVDAQRI